MKLFVSKTFLKKYITSMLYGIWTIPFFSGSSCLHLFSFIQVSKATKAHMRLHILCNTNHQMLAVFPWAPNLSLETLTPNCSFWTPFFLWLFKTASLEPWPLEYIHRNCIIVYASYFLCWIAGTWWIRPSAHGFYSVFWTSGHWPQTWQSNFNSSYCHRESESSRRCVMR